MTGTRAFIACNLALLSIVAGCAPNNAAVSTTTATTVSTAAPPANLTKIQAAGQLFCTAATADGPLVVGIADALGVPYIVTGLAAATVADACKAWNPAAVPVTPPASSVPTVAVAIPAA